ASALTTVETAASESAIVSTLDDSVEGGTGTSSMVGSKNSGVIPGGIVSRNPPPPTSSSGFTGTAVGIRTGKLASHNANMTTTSTPMTISTDTSDYPTGSWCETSRV